MSRRLGHGHSVWYRYGASTPRFNHHSKGAPALLLEVALAHVRLRAGEVITRDAGSAMSPFGSGRPVRPWLVVNLGGGTVAPRAAWLQHSSRNNFSAATRLPRGTNYFCFQALHAVPTAARYSPARPPSDGSQQGRTGATLFNQKGENIMANIGTFTAEKDGFTGQLRTLTPERQTRSQRQGRQRKRP